MNSQAPKAEEDSRAWAFAWAAWVLAMIAMLGSLFFGEVMKLPPCTLCWYQRICLFPLALLIAVGILERDPRLNRYTLPLVGVGLAIAAYHNLIYYGVLSEDLSPCTQGVSCGSRQIEWLGFITIPMLSFLGFLSILMCLVLHQRQPKRSPT